MEWILGRWWGRFAAVFAFVDVICNFWLYPIVNDGGEYGESYIDYLESEAFIVGLLRSGLPLESAVIDSLIGIFSILYLILSFVGFGFLVLIIQDPLKYALKMARYNGEI